MIYANGKGGGALAVEEGGMPEKRKSSLVD